MGDKVEVQQTIVEIEELKRLIASVAHEGMIIVEIGAFEGGNTIFIANAIRELNGAVVISVDSWNDREKLIKYFTNVSSFTHNGHVRAIWMYSIEAAGLFADGSLDLVYIDADHSYSHVIEDIKAWSPKVRQGGILCGHDCEQKYTTYSEEKQREIDIHKEDDKTPFSCHAGVVRALYDIYKDDYEKGKDRIWYKRIA